MMFYQVGNVKKSVVAGKELNGTGTTMNGMRREMMRMSSPQADRSNQYASQDNDDFISSESDRQLLLIRYCFFLLLPLVLLHNISFYLFWQ